MFGNNNDSGNGFFMPVAPAYGGGYGNGGGFGFGGDWAWILLLLLLGGNGYGWGGGFSGFGNMALGYDFPWLLNGQSGINANVNNGFRDQQLSSQLTGIQSGVTSGFADVQLGLAGVNQAICQTGNGISQQLYSNQLADLERSFAAQTASSQGMSAIQSQLAQCCCDNRAGLADLRYTVATENCADRAAISDGIRDLLAATQAQTQTILNQLCADKIEAKNDTIAQLRQELIFARGQASQDVQTAAIQAGQRALANEVEQYVAPRAVPAYAVQNPNCCNTAAGCGCGTF